MSTRGCRESTWKQQVHAAADIIFHHLSSLWKTMKCLMQKKKTRGPKKSWRNNWTQHPRNTWRLRKIKVYQMLVFQCVSCDHFNKMCFTMSSVSTYGAMSTCKPVWNHFSKTSERFSWRRKKHDEKVQLSIRDSNLTSNFYGNYVFLFVVMILEWFWEVNRFTKRPWRLSRSMTGYRWSLMVMEVPGKALVVWMMLPSSSCFCTKIISWNLIII